METIISIMDHIGRFEIYKTPSYEFTDFDGNGVLDRVQTGVNDVEVQFIPSDQQWRYGSDYHSIFNSLR